MCVGVGKEVKIEVGRSPNDQRGWFGWIIPLGRVGFLGLFGSGLIEQVEKWLSFGIILV